MATPKKSGNLRTGSITKVTWAHCARDVITRAMSTGQMLPLCIFVVIVILLTRLPAEEISGVFHDLINSLTNGSALGWYLCCVALVLWAGHAKIMRKSFSVEAERIGKEKTDLQQQQTNLPLGTSDQ